MDRDACVSRLLTLNDGSALSLRPIRPTDVEALKRGFARLTPEQVRHRVFHRMNELAPDVATRLCNVDASNGVAYVATDAAGEIHGDARYYLDESGSSAEFAIAIDPALVTQGIGRALMKCLLDSAQNCRLEALWGSVLVENSQMLDLANGLGARREPVADEPDLVHVRFDLKHAGADRE